MTRCSHGHRVSSAKCGWRGKNSGLRPFAQDAMPIAEHQQSPAPRHASSGTSYADRITRAPARLTATDSTITPAISNSSIATPMRPHCKRVATPGEAGSELASSPRVQIVDDFRDTVGFTRERHRPIAFRAGLHGATKCHRRAVSCHIDRTRPHGIIERHLGFDFGRERGLVDRFFDLRCRNSRLLTNLAPRSRARSTVSEA